jgi:uncharacterized repeat protein (TIGR01451 family)
MRPSLQTRRLVLAGTLTAVVLAVARPPAHAQAPAARVLVAGPIDARQLVRLPGNTRHEATAVNDRGRVPDEMPLEHMLLLLKRPPERELALQQHIVQLHDRRSASFHRWLSAAQLGERFGVAAQDLATVTAWLKQQGFTVNRVYPSTVMIDFSGTAGAVRNAFHTEMHTLAVRGVRHVANMSDPQIPAALTPLVAGIVTLNDFRPHPTLHLAHPGYTVSSSEHLVVPADLATIYNLNPLFGVGITGQGQTVVVIEDTDVYSASDWSTFRSVTGLSDYSSGSFTQVQPGGTNTCSLPVLNPNDQGEAILDAEWASAAAPGATIELASCADTSTTFGGLLALQNLVNASSPPPIVSISYAECELGNGFTANAAYSSTYEQAVSEGVSVFVAAGDWGAATCDAGSGAPYATQGIAVNGFASTAYNVAVGGTDFGDTYAGTTSTYWSTTNSTVYGSALSYIPEIPWNESCASSLIASFEGKSTTYGSSGFCNSSLGEKSFIDFIAGGGGPSACAIEGSGGGCAGTPKPSWQSAPGVPIDGVRDLPDVSLFAADGPWGHAYVFCDSDGSTCSGSTSPSSWVIAGGTSFASPILAGIQALVNQSTGARQGNPNFVYYTLASSQSASGMSCNSTLGSAVSSGCVFYDVTIGNTDVVCTGSDDCYLPSGTYGVLSTSNSSYAPAFNATTGWDFATGLGSINAANLVKYWSSSDLSLSAGGTVTSGGQLSYTLQVGDKGPQGATGVVVTTVLPAGLSLIAGMSSSGCSQSGQKVTCTVGSLAVGSPATLTVVVEPGPPETVNLVFSASSNNADLDPADGSTTVALDWTGGGGSDSPLPLWAYAALALLLVAVAARRPATA